MCIACFKTRLAITPSCHFATSFSISWDRPASDVKLHQDLFHLNRSTPASWLGLHSTFPSQLPRWLPAHEPFEDGPRAFDRPLLHELHFSGPKAQCRQLGRHLLCDGTSCSDDDSIEFQVITTQISPKFFDLILPSGGKPLSRCLVWDMCIQNQGFAFFLRSEVRSQHLILFGRHDSRFIQHHMSILPEPFLHYIDHHFMASNTHLSRCPAVLKDMRYGLSTLSTCTARWNRLPPSSYHSLTTR